MCEQKADHDLPVLGIKFSRRLISDQHRRVAGERTRNTYPLVLSAGQFFYGAGGLAGQPD